MRRFLIYLLIFRLGFTSAFSQPGIPQKSLNLYVEFINRSVNVVTGRFHMLHSYQAEVDSYRKKPVFAPKLVSSGPLEGYYYQNASKGSGLNAAERTRLNSSSDSLWKILEEIDATGKKLETYVRLKTFQDDNFKDSDLRVKEMQTLFRKFAGQKAALFEQLKKIYKLYQPDSKTDPYLNVARAMDQVLTSHEHLLNSLPFYALEDNPSEWPVGLVEQSMLDDEKMISEFNISVPGIAYPASDMIISFKSALISLQNLKKRAVDDHNFAARQSATHGNNMYFSLINQYNKDLLANHKAFVNYSQSARVLLDHPQFSPVFAFDNPQKQAAPGVSSPFEDKPLQSFTLRKSATPAPSSVVKTLNGFIEFINESLRQMHLIQVLTRNYQSSAERFRIPPQDPKRANLTYSHEDFKIPISEYQLLISSGNSIPADYRSSINSQAEVLLNMLKEMDALSIELTGYVKERRYLEDQLKRSDAILDRYMQVFDQFDTKKEQLYLDIRRIHESYPAQNPAGSWAVSGNGLLKAMDNNRNAMFSVKAFYKGEIAQVSVTEKLEADARQLIIDEYQNMKGLIRYGRSNGLCPYSPYEDLAENSSRFSEKVKKAKPRSPGQTTHPYESFYYFYNNELVYQYNKFVELAKEGLLKYINQPDVFVLQRLTPSRVPNAIARQPEAKPEPIVSKRPIREEIKQEIPEREKETSVTAKNEQLTRVRHDTIYVEHVRIDTVYLNQEAGAREVTRSLEGFAPNNMILLLDVSASMESPAKLPLLKRSIKSLLTLLRAEDQISIVLYSGKARVVLKPTSGTKAAEISRMIDLLQSSGNTDGNEGLRLAYKVANKEYLRSGNNRIVLATDGEFPVSDEVQKMISQNASQDVYLSVFTFGKNQHTGQKLKKLSELGRGTYAHITPESADLQLILEAQAKRAVPK